MIAFGTMHPLFGTLAFFALYACISAGGLSLIKISFARSGGIRLSTAADPLFWLGFVGYGIGFLMWMWFLSRNQLSLAFPLASGALFLAVSLFAIFALREEFTLWTAVGILLILAGMTVVTLAQRNPV